MKKHFLIAVFAFFFSLSAMAFGPLPPLDKKTIEGMNETQRNERIELLEKRLGEIREIPLNDLKRNERKDLRKEAKEIQKEMKTLQGAGVYISGGALLVALILVLLLI